MADLATISDINSRLRVPVATPDQTYVQGLIHDASVSVCSEARRPKGFVSQSLTQKLRPIGDKVILPVTPVVSIQSVAVLYNGNATNVPLWTFDGYNEVYIFGGETVVNLSSYLRDLFQFHTPEVQVTYTAGFTTVPDEIVSIVCNKVIRAMQTPDGTALSSQTAGPYAYRLSQAAQSGVFGFTDDERKILKRYRPKQQTIELR